MDHSAVVCSRGGFDSNPVGLATHRTFVDPQNPTRVAVLMDVPDMDAVMAAMQTESAAETMEHDGVVADTLVILVEA